MNHCGHRILTVYSDEEVTWKLAKLQTSLPTNYKNETEQNMIKFWEAVCNEVNSIHCTTIYNVYT